MSDTHTTVRPPENTADCRNVAELLARIGDKWTVMVVGVLSQGPMRYNEIQRQVGGISQRMLTLTLKELEQDGLVSRKMYPTIPPRVEYTLTKLGLTLIEPLNALHAWTVKHRPAILAARAAYAKTRAKPVAPFPAPAHAAATRVPTPARNRIASRRV